MLEFVYLHKVWQLHFLRRLLHVALLVLMLTQLFLALRLCLAEVLGYASNLFRIHIDSLAFSLCAVGANQHYLKAIPGLFFMHGIKS